MLFAVSDLHVSHAGNRAVVSAFWPETEHDWLILAGDIAEQESDFEWAISLLADRFEKVIWTPGNHELWSTPNDKLKLPGELRYKHLVKICRRYGVATPEDPFLRYTCQDGSHVTIAPIFTLYDYSFRNAADHTALQAVERARRSGAMSSDEFFLKAFPYQSVMNWCDERVAYTDERLRQLDSEEPIVLVSHFPLIKEATNGLKNPDFAIWCGTNKTRKMVEQLNAKLVIYGHLHLPSVDIYEGVIHAEVSLGYPKERENQPPNSFLVELETLLYDAKGENYSPQMDHLRSVGL
ncbi:metallophosphoesterase family protein [Algicola sagamiensis]|uniref:metallophosphoesterase family protein n=1 Tax=Algicola sagamiensis TaxID=163869 RepID=UPI00037577C8|nr:metallophosphoesterase [Algicola sagamiensis]